MKTTFWHVRLKKIYEGQYWLANCTYSKNPDKILNYEIDYKDCDLTIYKPPSFNGLSYSDWINFLHDGDIYCKPKKIIMDKLFELLL